MTTTAQPSRFVSRVRGEMAIQKLGVRGLARRMDPNNIDRARRNLHRWLDEGISPNRASRREVAVALNLPSDEFDSDDDEEGRAAMTFDDFLRSRVREIMAEERKERGTA